MVTINNQPPQQDSSAGIIVGTLVVIVIVALFLIYGLPKLRGASNKIEINLPDKSMNQ